MNEETVARLRELGYAVVVFSPNELKGASPDDVGSRLIELGWEVIDCLSDEE